jgi:aspartate racemase
MDPTEHIGIAGVSAEGAALCYRTLCVEGAQVFGRHAHPEVTMHTYPLAEYMRYIETDRWDDVGELLLASARKLVAAGARILICPDNTVHQGLDLVRDALDVRWLHIAEEVAAVAAERGFGRLGVLGTRFLMEGPVYPSKLAGAHIDHVVPEAAERRRIDALIFDDLVYGRFEDTAREYLRDAIAALGRQGCDAVVLGCTELPLLISEGDDAPLPVLDSTRILARAALREAAHELGS